MGFLEGEEAWRVEAVVETVRVFRDCFARERGGRVEAFGMKIEVGESVDVVGDGMGCGGRMTQCLERVGPCFVRDMWGELF